jgi:hypothetical protein
MNTQPVFEENAVQKNAPLDQGIFVGGAPIFFYFHIWTTEVKPCNALNSEFANFETPCIQYVSGLSLQEGFFFKFLFLRKNFRGITFFASSETPISVIKIKENAEKIFSFFLKIHF